MHNKNISAKITVRKMQKYFFPKITWVRRFSYVFAVSDRN